MRSRKMWWMIGGLVGSMSLGTFALAGEQATTAPGMDPNTQPRTDRDSTPTDPQTSGSSVPAGAAKQPATGAATGLTAPAVGSAQMGDPTWIATKLHRINQGEIKVANIERAQGESAKAKAFATQIARDHERADRQLMAYAKQKKIDLNAVPTTGESDDSRDRAASSEDEDDIQMQVTLKELKALKGADLDRQFVSTMLNGHAKAMDLVRNARAATRDRQLQALLDGLLPALENHHRLAAMLNNTLGGTSSIEPTHRQ